MHVDLSDFVCVCVCTVHERSHFPWEVRPLGRAVRGCKFDCTQVEAISSAIQFLSSVAGELPADVCVSSKEIKHL